MKTIGITGGTGFIGQHLTNQLIDNNYNIIIFTRHPQQKKETYHIQYAYWDPENHRCDTDAIQQVNTMVHLAGAGIADKRWTEKRKKEIVDSRVEGTAFLTEQLKIHGNRCDALIAASATGFYGPDRPGIIPFKEDTPPYNDFLGNTCVKWENETEKAKKFLRTVILRFGIVLGKESGAFPQFEQPMKYGIKPILGSGRQIVSWINVEDLCRLIIFAIGQPTINGTYNAVAPHPVSHKKLMRTIAKVKGGIKIPAPVPAFVLRLLLGEMSEEVLKSCTASAEKIQHAGFTFKYPYIQDAVRAILE